MSGIEPIGTVESCYPEKFGTPRQPGVSPSSRAFLKLNGNVQPELSLEGLNQFSHLWVIFIFHKNNNARFHAKVHPPRMEGENIGVFATRSPHRPNPIGLSLVQIESVEKNGVWVTGVDLIEGTPILDIKPYLPQFESKPDAKSGWAEKPVPDIAVQWTKEAWAQFEQFVEMGVVKQAQAASVRSLIEETLKADPRPVIFRGIAGTDSPYSPSHKFYVYDLDVHFTYVTDTLARVDNILRTKNRG